MQLVHTFLFAVVHSGAGFFPLQWHQTREKAEGSGCPRFKDQDLWTSHQGNHIPYPLVTLLTALQLWHNIRRCVYPQACMIPLCMYVYTDIECTTALDIWMYDSNLLFQVMTLILWCDKPPAALGFTVKRLKVDHYPLPLPHVSIYWPQSVASWDQKHAKNAFNLICG